MKKKYLILLMGSLLLAGLHIGALKADSDDDSDQTSSDASQAGSNQNQTDSDLPYTQSQQQDTTTEINSQMGQVPSGNATSAPDTAPVGVLSTGQSIGQGTIQGSGQSTGQSTGNSNASVTGLAGAPDVGGTGTGQGTGLSTGLGNGQTTGDPNISVPGGAPMINENKESKQNLETIEEDSPSEPGIDQADNPSGPDQTIGQATGNSSLGTSGSCGDGNLQIYGQANYGVCDSSTDHCYDDVYAKNNSTDLMMTVWFTCDNINSTNSYDNASNCRWSSGTIQLAPGSNLLLGWVRRDQDGEAWNYTLQCHYNYVRIPPPTPTPVVVSRCGNWTKDSAWNAIVNAVGGTDYDTISSCKNSISFDGNCIIHQIDGVDSCNSPESADFDFRIISVVDTSNPLGISFERSDGGDPNFGAGDETHLYFSSQSEQQMTQLGNACNALMCLCQTP